MGCQELEPGTIARDLRLLASLCAQWLQASETLPARFCAVKNEMQALLAGADSSLKHRASRALSLVDSGVPDAESLPQFCAQLDAVMEAEKAEPDWREAGSIYSCLHGQIQNVSNLLLTAPEEVARRCRDLLSGLTGSVEDARIHSLVQSIGAAAALHDFAELPEAVRELRQYLESRSAERAEPVRSERHLVVSVEDDPLWQQAIQEAIRGLQALPDCAAVLLDYHAFGDRASAEAFLAEVTAGYARSAQQPFVPQLHVILDLGIPDAPGATSGREEGLGLLRALRDRGIAADVIVLTAPANSLSDQVEATALGVRSYIFKDAGASQKLADALLNLIHPSPRPRLEILQATGRRIRIDGVEIALQPAGFHLLVALSEAPNGITAEELAQRLAGAGAESPTEPPLGADAFETSMRANWKQAVAHARSRERAVEWLRSERYGLWKRLRSAMLEAGADPDTARAVAGFVEEHYGDARDGASKAPTPHAIAERVSQLRRAIASAVVRSGGTAGTGQRLIRSTSVGGCFCYYLDAHIVDEAGDGGGCQSPLRVLVVENDVAVWQRPIVELLESYGLEARAAGCAEEALRLVADYAPDVICLDLHIPRTVREFRERPLTGDVAAGLEVLREARARNASTVVVALTSLANRDTVRAQAGDLGIRVDDFVEKGHDWRAALISRVTRAEQELRTGSHRPLGASRLPVPYLHVFLRDGQPCRLDVFGKTWRPTPLQMRLVWTLARRCGQPVPTETVLDEVYGDTDCLESLKQLVKNTRKRIAVEWLPDWAGGVQAASADTILANDARRGWILNARAQVTELPHLPVERQPVQEGTLGSIISGG